MFKIIEYLEDKNIQYKTEGKNITRGWININCPWCSDPSEHLGIVIENGEGFNCWICGEKGHISKLIYEIEGSWSLTYKVLKEYGDNSTRLRTPEDNTKHTFCTLPPESTSIPCSNHERYLMDREFDCDYLIDKYKIKFIGPVGKWCHRIVIPIFLNKRIVSFTTRDVTGKAISKYKNCPNDLSEIPISHLLYNIDNCKEDWVVVVEGPTDVWRLGDNSVALFGNVCSPNQLIQLNKFKRIYILLDADAEKQTKKLSRNLLNDEVIELTIENIYKDPASLSNEKAKEIMRKLEEHS